MGLIVEIAIVAAAVWMIWRSFTRHQRTVTGTVRRGGNVAKDTKPLTLVKDPVTGVYRPADPKE